MPEPLELSAATGLIGFAIGQTLSMYREAAPKLPDLRKAYPGDYAVKQQLLDADIYGGIAVLLLGGTATLLTRDFAPLLLAGIGLVCLSFYYRTVYNSASPEQVLRGETNSETTAGDPNNDYH